MTYLEHINGPQDLKGLTQEQLCHPGQRDPRCPGGVGDADQRSPRPEPRRGGADPGHAPGVRLAQGQADLRHRPPVLCAQAADRPPERVPHAAPDRRPVRLPEPRRVRARPGGELARLHQPVLRRRDGQGVPAAGRARPDRGRGDRRRRADRRDGLGGAEQHRRRPRLAAGHRRQRQRPLLPADDRRARQPPVDDPRQPALRAGPRPDQDHGDVHPDRRQPALRRAARGQEGPQGLPPAAGAVRGPRHQVHRPGRRPRRGDGGARAAPGGRVRPAGAGARDHPQGVRLRPGRAERRGLPAPGPGAPRRPRRPRPSRPRPRGPGPTCSPTRW